MDLDKKELLKLSPEARIKRLKEFEELSKKEIEEADNLIKRARDEITKLKDMPDIETPEMVPVDISKLFEPEQGLEFTVAGAKKTEEESGPVRYTLMEEIEEKSVPPYDTPDNLDIESKPIEANSTYKSTFDQADTLTASKSALASTKKYFLR